MNSKGKYIIIGITIFIVILIVYRLTRKNMKLNRAGRQAIKQHEEFRSNPYKDTGGVATIGYGFTYYPGTGRKVTMSDASITKAQGDKMFLEMIKTFEEAVNQYVTSNINQNQFNALVSFAYNVGIPAFKNSTLLQVINQNPDNPEVATQFRRWKYDNNVIIPGLINRREKEIEMYFKNPLIV